MRRTLHTVLLLAAVIFISSEVKRYSTEEALNVTPQQIEWLNKRLELEAYIRDLESKLALLKARYNAIPAGSSEYHPWSSASDIRKRIEILEQDTRFKASCGCTKVSEQMKEFCSDWKQAKADQDRWYQLAKLSVEINAVTHSLTEARIEAGHLGDTIPVEQAKKQLMNLVRRI